MSDVTDATKDPAGRGRRSRKTWIIGGAAALAVAAGAVTVPSLMNDDDSRRDTAKDEVSTTSTRPGVTRTYTNAATSLSLTTGSIGASGKGKVFVQFAGNGTLEQSFNLLRDKIIARGLSRGNALRCVEANTENKAFVTNCVANKTSQKWAHKIVVKASGAFPDQVLVQNFATKKCLTAGPSTGRGTATVFTKTCNANDRAQRWTQSTFAGRQ